MSGIIRKNRQIGSSLSKLFECTAGMPQLDNTLARTLLCDSRGQHKDQRNARRLASVDVTAIEAKIADNIATLAAQPAPKKESIFNLY